MNRSRTAATITSLALALTLSHASAHTPADTRPPIGTPAYDAGCVVTQAWEDGSAVASCAEDGAEYVYDPDGQPVDGIAGSPMRGPGWYVIK